MRSAAAVGTALILAALGCRAPAPARGADLYSLPVRDPAGERSCAWFADARDDVLYFGVSAFWSALRASGGDATADLRAPGPRWIGRFDLAAERQLPPLVLGSGPAASGVWDVLAHPNGRLYYTTYFDAAGSVDLATGEQRSFEAAGLGLNELALGPEGRVLVTRYGYGADDEGSLVELSEAGEVLAEHVLADPPGRRTLAKSLAFDPLRQETWINTDLLPLAGSGGATHDARVLDRSGRERLELADPELHFFVFGPDGTGWFAEVSEGRLRLRIRSPAGLARFVPLDDAFDGAHDFVQDLRIAGDGSAVLMRWSGRVHVVEPDGRVRDLELPRSGAGELYYTAVRRGERICATRCGSVDVMCADLPRP